MKVIISAGGTGGHIYPALAIISKIKEKEPDSEFLYIGTHDRMEKDIIPAKGIPFESITIYGFNRKKLYKNFRTVKTFYNSYKRCKNIIKEFNPDIVIGVGGYVTGPVIYAAKKLGYKTLIHEQNSVPGRCNTFLKRYSDKIAISLPSSKKYFDQSKVVFTGNPCSSSALEAPKLDKTTLGLSKDKKLVLFAFGSLGSSKLNDLIIKTMNSFKDKNYEILFITGKQDYENVSKNSFPTNVKVIPYLENTPRIMKSTDVFVSRAGASFLSEIIALNVASILIPSPYVPDNHQYKNALELKEKNACILIEEKDLTSEMLVNNIDNLLNDNEYRETIKNNLNQLKVEDSASKIYELIREIIGDKK